MNDDINSWNSSQPQAPPFQGGVPADLLLKQMDVSGQCTTHLNLEASLQALAYQASHLLNAQRCSMLLFAEPDHSHLKVYYCASFPAALKVEVTELDRAIAIYTFKKGQSLLVRNIKSVPFSLPKSYPLDALSLISVPLYQSNQMIGTIIVACPLQKKLFVESDLELLKLLAHLASQSIQINHLQSILKSRFVSTAVAREIEEKQQIEPHHSKLAKIVAKSFFREVTQAGFSPPQIIEIATEVLNLLHITLDRHRQRLTRDD